MNSKSKKNQLWVIAPTILLALAWIISPIISSNAAILEFLSDEFRIEASMSGAPINGTTPFGKAEYRVEDNTRRRFKVEIYSVNLPAGTVLNVIHNNNAVGTLTINSFGSGQFDVRTDNGQNVPVAANGQTVALLNGATTIASGVFGITSPSPSVSPSGSPSISPSVSPSASPNVSPTVSPSVSPSPSASPGGIFAQLSGATINGAAPTGFSEYSLSQSDTNRRVRVWVNNVNLPAGTALTVFVNNINLGQFGIFNGSGEFRIESRDNPIVPVVTPGTPIRVQNGDAPILSGVYSSGISPSPSPSVSPSVSPSATPSVSPSATPSISPSPSPSVNPRFYEAELRGSQVVPAVSTNGRSVAKILVNTAQTEMQVVLSFFGLNGNQTTATINGAALPGINAPVIFNIGTIGGTSGFFPTRTFQINQEQAAQLRAGLLYVVIGSASSPGGEIRGQIRVEDNIGDFEGDGRTDLAVFRESNGTFYFLNSSDNQFRTQLLGGANDTIVSGDYDGDGVTDAAVYSSVNGAGVWRVRRSSENTVSTEQWGLADDIPVSADFDGDGRNDLVVFRPSNGVWYIRRSSDNSIQYIQWGANGDKPLSGDFDGDGRSDAVVYRPSTGVWYALKSSTQTIYAVQWGTTEDIPQTGDYDGDGVTDTAVFRPSNGVWYIIRSIDGSFVFRQWGQAGDIPAAGQYDADTLADVAVFRPSDGTWYIIRTSDENTVSAQFGVSGDVPAARR